MKIYKIAKLISIISYLLIILMGMMIGIPFFIWLLLTLFDFGNADQLFAFFGVIGLIILFTTFNSIITLKILLLDIVCFVLLVSPIIRRLTAIPIEQFNYSFFIIPTTFFLFFYLFSFYFSVKQYFQNQQNINIT